MTENNKVTVGPKEAKVAKKASVVSAFEDLKGQQVPEGTTSQEGSVGALMTQVFQAYPDSVFTQKDFVVKLNISNPFANHQLHALMDKGVIKRVGSARKYYYSLVQ
jgi:hypothetical protein